MKNISKNIKYLREINNLSQEGFGKLFGLTRGQVASYEKEENPSEPDIQTIISICSHFSVSIEPFLRQSLADYVSFDDKNFDNSAIFLLDTKAAAGFTTELNNTDFWGLLPKFKLPMTNWADGLYISLQVQGDSMYPTFSDSDWVVARKEENPKELRPQNYYVVLTTSGALVKRLSRLDFSTRKILLSSDNKIYPPQEIHLDDVLQFYQVRAKISLDPFPNKSENNTELDHVKTQMEILMEELNRIKQKINV